MQLYKTLFLLIFVFFTSVNVKSETTQGLFPRYSSCTSPRPSDNNGMELMTTMVIPELSPTRLKGYMGTIGIIGGYNEFAGPPYFAAMGALKVGADAVHIFCTIDSADTIQMLSPDIVVHPVYNAAESTFLAHITPMDALVMGPGLDPQLYSQNLILKVIDLCKRLNKPLVLDLPNNYLTPVIFNALINYPPPGVILLTNANEFETLYKIMRVSDGTGEISVQINFQKYGKNLFIVRKGCSDHGISSSPLTSWTYNEDRNGRRTNGQGNFMAGITGTYFLWATRYISKNYTDAIGTVLPAAVASYSASKLVRSIGARAIGDYGRSMITSDMLEVMHDIVYDSY